jgi:ATP-dependent helicase HrpA
VAGEVERRLADLTNPAFSPAATDLQTQLDALVYPGWVTATGRARLRDIHRYLRAMVHRLDRLPGGLTRDADNMETIARVTTAWHQALDHSATAHSDPALAEVRWTIEELRVSLFAQSLGTPFPVSEKRVLRAIERIGS